ncbi:hypothetical protein LEP1GSC188_3354 [Leptospira weilii serovar Topaz str. LT2116]|uniref:Uncharacterized protein n=1 Tax=Leptospira weilii serovar Topaz str. LT2116 TaxID=1088540 RepID=M3H090_9LEPT|nr:hypothetical protein LEP1GSC188_3354 [Leptospira weilii serovar Topaz str. LT2116]
MSQNDSILSESPRIAAIAPTFRNRLLDKNFINFYFDNFLLHFETRYLDKLKR